MKKVLLLFSVLALSFTLFAKKVDKDVAKRIAGVVMTDREISDVSVPQLFDNLYIFNCGDGFVIVSADDCYNPVIAYSDEFPFVTEAMPDNIKCWLGSMNNEVGYFADNNIEATEEVAAEWADLRRGVMPAPKTRTSVSPMVHTHWGQGTPYNNMCPSTTTGNGLCPVGCAATAMAQVMKFWEWPKTGNGSHSYNSSVGGTQSANFGNTTYDWDNMIDRATSSSTQAQQDAVAVLSYHCGVSINMGYGNSGSGAYPSDVISALKTYFDYSSGIGSASRNYYTLTQWVDLLKTEINSGRPILYSGWDNAGGGHSFVCDGYDNNDYFHFNWGWNGSCDGYYAIGYLSPGQGGTGAGSGCYNENNYILTGVQPNNASIAAPSNVTASVNGRDVTLSWSAVSGAARYKVYRNGFILNSNVTATSFTDTDVAYGSHTYQVRSVMSNGNYSHSSNPVVANVSFPGPVPTNLTASVNNNNVHLSWNAPASENAVLKYGDSSPSSSAYGFGSEVPFYWGQCYTPEQLVPYAGMAIQSVQVYHGDVHQYTLHIYKNVNGVFTEVVSKDYNTTTANAWFTVTLPSPCVIDYSNDLYVVVSSADLSYPGKFTNYSGNTNAALYSSNGTGYSAIDNISWLIKTNISDGTYTYDIFRNGSTIATNYTQTSYNDNNLAVGTYNYSVKTNYYGGQSNASNTATAVVNNNALAVTVTNVLPPACHGGDDGSVTVNASNGTPPYIYYMNGQSSPSTNGSYTFGNLSAGTYTVSVSDNASGTASTSATVNDPAELVISIAGNTNIVSGQSTTLTANGADTYLWNTGATTQSITVSPTTTTTYSVTGSNSAGCTADAQVTVTVSNSNINLVVDNINEVTCNGGDDGTITVTVFDGIAPFIFSIGSQTSAPTNNATYNFEGLSSGTYEMSVTDNIGNTASTSASIGEPEALQPGSIGTSGETLCFGDNAQTIPSVIDASSVQPGFSYRWKENGAVIPNSNVNQYTPLSLSSGMHVFTREVTDDCSDWTQSAGEWIVTVEEEVVVEISGNTTIILGETTTLTANGAERYEWNTGETTASINVSPTENTEYSVTGFVGDDCYDVESVIVVVSPDAIGESANRVVTVYPNPAEEKVRISCENMNDITIMTVTGRIVGYVKSDSDIMTVDVSTMSAGTYVLLIRDKNDYLIRKSLIVY
ncbi:MAG: C10 family peptidase [Candidatus Limimorpha sp.]